MNTLTEAAQELEDGDPVVTQMALRAREDALISGAPAIDAAMIGIEAIVRLAGERTRARISPGP